MITKSDPSSLTVPEVATILGCRPSLIYKLCERRRIGHTRLGFGRGAIRITPAQLDEYRQSVEVVPASERAAEPNGRRRAGERASGIPDVLGEFRRAKRRKGVGA